MRTVAADAVLWHAPVGMDGQADDVAAHAHAAPHAATARARELRADAAALRAEAHQRRHHAQVRNALRHVELIAHELSTLDAELERWEGATPPLEHLLELIETVEADLGNLEAELGQLRPPPAD